MKRNAKRADTDGSGAGQPSAATPDAAGGVMPMPELKDWDDFWANAKPFTDDMVEAVMEQQREDIEMGRWLARRRRGD